MSKRRKRRLLIGAKIADIMRDGVHGRCVSRGKKTVTVVRGGNKWRIPHCDAVPYPVFRAWQASGMLERVRNASCIQID